MRPEELDAWMRLGAIALTAALAHLLLIVSRGTRITRSTIARHISRAALTGILAAGVHSLITQFYVVSPTFGVFIASTVAMIGVDTLQAMTRTVIPQLVEKRLGVDLSTEKSKDNDGEEDVK